MKKLEAELQKQEDELAAWQGQRRQLEAKRRELIAERDGLAPGTPGAVNATAKRLVKLESEIRALDLVMASVKSKIQDAKARVAEAKDAVRQKSLEALQGQQDIRYADVKAAIEGLVAACDGLEAINKATRGVGGKARVFKGYKDLAKRARTILQHLNYEPPPHKPREITEWTAKIVWDGLEPRLVRVKSVIVQ